MCGIWALLGSSLPEVGQVKEYVDKLSSRGPEDTRIMPMKHGVLGFTRLAINGLNPLGMQPFSLPGLTWMCNGEIYNAKELSAQYNIPMPSGSDCEVLGPLYKMFRDQQNLPGFFRALDGVFAIVIYDEECDQLVFGRDPYGIRPMFGAWSVDGIAATPDVVQGMKDVAAMSVRLVCEGAKLTQFCISSEQKAIPANCQYSIQFSPGNYGTMRISTCDYYYEGIYHRVPWVKNPLYTPAHPEGYEFAKQAVRFALEKAVEKRLMTERPVAALLSGGLDSSLIASLVQKNLKELGLPSLKTFSIGMPGSTDLAFAKIVAEHIQSDHTEIILTAEEFLEAIPAVVHDIESYDITTVRASVGNWLVSKKIRELSDCKVVFNGDGSDEVFGSYLYFYNAPNDQAYEDEVERLLDEICYYDVLRSDRSISSHGLEPRTPFLDKQFVAVCRSVATCWRRPIKGKAVEKQLLRDAFANTGLLPNAVLWRKKEAFSDGVSSQEKSWYEIIQDAMVGKVKEGWQEDAKQFTYLTPKTPEAFYYRMLYDLYFGAFPAETCIPDFWMPRWTPGATDPSARTLKVYSEVSDSSNSK